MVLRELAPCLDELLPCEELVTSRMPYTRRDTIIIVVVITVASDARLEPARLLGMGRGHIHAQRGSIASHGDSVLNCTLL